MFLPRSRWKTSLDYEMPSLPDFPLWLEERPQNSHFLTYLIWPDCWGWGTMQLDAFSLRHIQGHSKYSTTLTNIMIKHGNNRDTVDQVKPAFIKKADLSMDTPSDASADSFEPVPEVQPDTTAPTNKQTKSRWKVTFPRKFKSYIYF